MGTVRTPSDDMRDFMNAGIHGVESPKITICAFRLPEEGRIVTYNDHPVHEGRRHAEDYVLQKLETRLKNRHPPIDVVIYSNKSPCGRCCNRIEEFLARFPCYTLTIVFSSLFNINRPSCKMRDPPCTYQHTTDYSHQYNLNGLKSLLTKAHLRPFQQYDWQALSRMLLGFPVVKKARQVEDEFVQHDWMELVMKPFEQGHN